MRMSQILNVIEKELSESDNLDCRLLEFKLTANNTRRNKNRVIYCFLPTNENVDDIVGIINRAADTYFTVVITNFMNITEAKVRVRSSLNDPSIIENNWRGRLFSFDSLIANSSTDEEAQKFLFESTWRVIINRDSHKNYYTRHDIFPYFWNPGHSTAGKSEYIEAVTHEFWKIADQSNNLTDLHFDRLKFFAKREDQNNFTAVSSSDPTTAHDLMEYSLSLDTTREHKKLFLDGIIQNLQVSFFND